MRVWLEHRPADGLGLTPNDIVKALQGAEHPGGGRPDRRAADRRRPQFQLNIQTKGRLTEPEEFENVVVRANPDGSFVRVRDVGRVELGARTSRLRSAASTAGRVP